MSSITTEADTLRTIDVASFRSLEIYFLWHYSGEDSVADQFLISRS